MTDGSSTILLCRLLMMNLATAIEQAGPNKTMNTPKVNIIERRKGHPQPASELTADASCPSLVAQQADEAGTASSAVRQLPAIDMNKLALDAALLLEQKANSGRSSDVKSAKQVEPSGVFNKRAGGRP